MPKIAYKPKVFVGERLERIEHANAIVEEYAAQGFNLTLRQLYYQFVARDLLANNFRNYKNLGTLIDDARHAGLIDWDRITDRTRNLVPISTWDDPTQIVEAVAAQYKEDLWATQETIVEVWVEKDALTGVIDPICRELRLPYFACRGYASASEMWSAGQRAVARWRVTRAKPFHQRTVILHLGDHDPSGIDMSRDIADRLELFASHHRAEAPEVKRIALNMDQITQYDPPENPAKLTDSRADGYINQFGYSSWELDALSPTVLSDLIRAEVEPFVNRDTWATEEAAEKRNRKILAAIAKNWESVEERFGNDDDEDDEGE